MIRTRALSDYSDGISSALGARAERGLLASRHAAYDAMDSLRSNSRQLRDAVLDTRDDTMRYMRHQPVKSALIAVAAGVVVLGLVALLSELRRRD